MKADRKATEATALTRGVASSAPGPSRDSLDAVARRVAGAMGNAAFSHLLRANGAAPVLGPIGGSKGLQRQSRGEGGAPAASGAATTAPPTTGATTATGTTPAPGGAIATDWEQSGNLHGQPPVRNRHTPPNTAVVEDEVEYQALFGQAMAALIRQQERADSLVNQQTNQITDFRWFFARVYSHVTDREMEFCESGAYYYPSYVLRCVLYFDRIYADNFRAFDQHGPVEAHWRRAFEQCRTSQQAVQSSWTDISRMYHEVRGAGEALTISMKAHIRFDLPRAEAWVFNAHYAGTPGARQQDFQSDFFSMSGVFDQAARDFAPEMASAIGLPTQLIPQLMQDTSMRYIFSADMATERADTWSRAMALGPGAGAGPYQEDPATHGFAGAGNVIAGAGGQGNLAAIGSLSNPDLRPSMDTPMRSGDDDSAHAALDHLPPGGIAAIPLVRRAQYLRQLFEGATIGNDETLILRILRESTGDFVTLVDAADAWDLMYALDIGAADALRNLFRERYYAQTAQVTALRLVYKCIDGETAEWEEHMIADIIELRADRTALVEAIGRHYTPRGGDPIRDGVTRLDSELVGEDEDRVHRALGLVEESWRHPSRWW
jgi:hypothetical protein